MSCIHRWISWSSLEYLATVDYTLTGQFIDLRNGIIYVSLIGVQATLAERNYFIALDKKNGYRKKLLKLLQDLAKDLNITDKVSILEGGSVGIGIHPVEYDKVQVACYIEENMTNFGQISYFGDKWTPEGNDYKLLNHAILTGYKVSSVDETIQILRGSNGKIDIIG